MSDDDRPRRRLLHTVLEIERVLDDSDGGGGVLPARDGHVLAVRTHLLRDETASGGPGMSAGAPQ